MWRIGGIGIGGRVVLGPMSGFTSESYRDFMKPFGVAVSVTEMTSDQGIIHGLRRTVPYVSFGDNHPTGVQLFGSDPGSLAEAAAKALVINPDIDFFDINMGCPVAKVVRNGSGSALMRDPAKCGDIIRRVRKAAGIPVTAKIRLGWNSSNMNFREVIEEVTAAGADAVSLHVRTREERYAGTPHYDLAEGLRSEMSVPLIISGNIYSAEDAEAAVQTTGADAVMVARGGVGNPFLVTQINSLLESGKSLPNPTVSQQVDWCLRFADMLIAEKGEEVAVRKLRSYAPHFIAGCHRCRGYRNRLSEEVVDRGSLVSIMEEIRGKMGSERIRTDGRAVRPDGDVPDDVF